MGIEPTHQLVTGALVLKTRRPTRRLGTSYYSYSFTQKGLVCKKLSGQAAFYPLFMKRFRRAESVRYRGEMVYRCRVQNYSPEEAKTE